MFIIIVIGFIMRCWCGHCGSIVNNVGLNAERGVNAEVPNIFGGVEKVPEGEGKKLYV